MTFYLRKLKFAILFSILEEGNIYFDFEFALIIKVNVTNSSTIVSRSFDFLFPSDKMYCFEIDEELQMQC